jgi:TonB family protein
VATTADALPPTANDRLKERFEPILALSLLAATVTHLLVLELWPAMSTPVQEHSDRAIAVIAPLDPIDLPPPPEALARPLAPVASTNVSPDVTIPEIPWDRPVALPPPPPEPVARGGESAVPFTPWDVPPRIANPVEVQRALERAYPPLLRDAGIEGTVELLVHIDARGRVIEARIGKSSGFEALDTAARSAVSAYRFHPAQNRDVPTAVWTSVPVTFEVRR